jgi:prevent-host-death family protein
MQETIPVSKFKATCLRLLANVKRTGKSIIVTRNGEPIALVTPPPASAQTGSVVGLFERPDQNYR